MSTENIEDFYESLGFEETEIEDNLTTFGWDNTADDNYALVTNDEGKMPESVKQNIIFAYYSAEGSFLWSVSFKNSYIFKDIWSGATTADSKLDAVQKHRASNE